MHTLRRFVLVTLCSLLLLAALTGCASDGYRRDLDQAREQQGQAARLAADAQAEMEALTLAMELLEPNSPAWLALKDQRDVVAGTKAQADTLARALQERISRLAQQIEAEEQKEDAWIGLAGTLGSMLGPLTGGVSVAIPAIAGAVVYGRRQRKNGATQIAEALAIGRATIPQLDQMFASLSDEQKAALNTLYGDLAGVVEAHRRVKSKALEG